MARTDVTSLNRPAAGPRLDVALRHEAADLRVAVLRALADGSSIAQAARQLGMSYRAAWQALDTLSNLAGVALVERAVGGAGGGGARLTPAGRQVLEAATKIEAARTGVLRTMVRSGKRGVLAPSSAAQFPGLGAVPSLDALGLRTSMRNVCHAVVTEVELSRPAALVMVSIAAPARQQPASRADEPPAGTSGAAGAAGARVAVQLTRESAELLGLIPGLQVLLLCKAMAARIEPWSAPAPTASRPGKSATATSRRPQSAAQMLAATVLRSARAAKGEVLREVTVALRDAPEVIFVGLASVMLSMRRGARVGLRLDPASLVLALPG